MGRLTVVENHCSTEAPIAASSDIHSPRLLGLFRKVLSEYGYGASFFVLAGDIVDKGDVDAAGAVFDLIKNKFNNINIISVFGNEEYHDRTSDFKKKYPHVIWLDDDYKIFECGDKQIAFVGTRGALERPTRWQRRHMPWLKRVYEERPRVIKELIVRAKSEADYVVLVSHYALTKATIIGEPKTIWPEIYSSKMEQVLIETRPDIAIHGHAHRGRPFALLKGIRVYNVALPVNRRVVPIFLRKKSTLLDWLEPG